MCKGNLYYDSNNTIGTPQRGETIDPWEFLISLPRDTQRAVA